MKALSADSLLARFLSALAAAIFRHPRWFIVPQALLFVFCVYYSARYLQADMNENDLVGPNHKYQQNFLEMQKEFPEQGNDLAVVVQSGSLEKNRQFVERLAMKMAPETNLFRDIFYEQDLPMMGTKALYFAPTNDLAMILATIHDDSPFIKKFTQTTNLISFFEEINTAIRTAPRETNAQTESLVQALPVLTRIVSQANDALQMSGTPPSPGVASLFGADDLSQIYVTRDHGRIFLLTTHPPNDSLNGEAIAHLRQLIRETKDEVPGVNAGLTGESVLDYDRMIQSQKDVSMASAVSLLLCALIFIYGYNETGRPIKATICLVIGLAYTLAFTTLAIGHLNILTVTFVPMLIGLAIDFGVHLITRYEEELRHGRTKEVAMTKAMVYTGQGIFTGALTTAGAFLAMYFTNFRGIQEMGLICGFGLILCFVPMMTVLPALLLRGRQNVMDHDASEDETRAQIENIWLQRPVIVVSLTAVLCGLAWMGARKVQFDYNLLKLMNPLQQSVIFTRELSESDQSVLSGAIVATNLDQAIALEHAITNLPTVADVEPPLDVLNNFFASNQTDKLVLIRKIKQEVSDLHFAPPDTNTVKVNDLSLTLYSLYGYAGAALAEIGNSDAGLTSQFAALRLAIENLRKTMLTGDDRTLQDHGRKLAEFQVALLDDVRDSFTSLQNQNDTSPLQVDDLPAATRDQFVGLHGEFLLQVFPKEDVWQRAAQERFVADLRTIDPDTTGTPVQLLVYETLLKNSYLQAAWYSLAAVALLVLFHFRSLGAVVLSLLPVVIGTLWLLGLMGHFGVAFNMANIMTLPLVIGIGVTNGVHILNRFAEERTPGILARSTGKAVLVSGLTAIAGFGSLILASDRGIHSLGWVMSAGIAACMIAGLTFLPAFLNLLGRWHPLIKQPSANNHLPAPGQEEPRSKTSSNQ
jgi:hypothetical protein